MSVLKTSRIVTRKLYVKLDHFEKEQTVQQLLDDLKAKNEIELKVQELKDQAKKYERGIEPIEDDIQSCQIKLTHGKLLDVSCKLVMDHQTRTFYILRKDTHEIIEEGTFDNEVCNPKLEDEVEEEEIAQEKVSE